MRLLPILMLCASAVLATGPAHAETRVFIIANNADGYGVDRCLATGASCGNVVATAYCHAQAFDEARSFRKIERDELTGTVASETPVCRSGCNDYVAIECIR